MKKLAIITIGILTAILALGGVQARAQVAGNSKTHYVYNGSELRVKVRSMYTGFTIIRTFKTATMGAVYLVQDVNGRYWRYYTQSGEFKAVNKTALKQLSGKLRRS